MLWTQALAYVMLASKKARAKNTKLNKNPSCSSWSVKNLCALGGQKILKKTSFISPTPFDIYRTCKNSLRYIKKTA